jgi:hypothetical protein
MPLHPLNSTPPAQFHSIRSIPLHPLNSSVGNNTPKTYMVLPRLRNLNMVLRILVNMVTILAILEILYGQ